MTLRRSIVLPWQKYLRFGGLLLAIVLFLPVLGVFVTKSMLFVRHGGVSMMGTTAVRDLAPESCCGDEMMGGRFGREGMMGDFNGAVKNSPAPMMSTTVRSILPVERSIAKNAALDLRAESLAWTSGKIQEIVKNVGGYVESAQVSEPKVGIKTAWMTVRVPSDRLDTTVDEVKKTASAVMSESLNTGDVTDQGIDLSARLKAKAAEENALVTLLERAEKVSDVIEITGRLTLVRSEIERLLSEQRLLENQVALSSIAISITEDPRAVANTEPVRNGNVLKQSLSELYQFGIALGSGLVMLLVTGLPVVVIYGFFFWVLYRLGRFVAERVVGKKK